MRKTMEQLSPFFSQQFGLKKLLMQEACEKVLYPIKKKVMDKQEKYAQKLAAKGGSLEEE
jgi:hypothetical protein